MESLTVFNFILAALVVINILSFSLVAYDKRRSVGGAGKDRLPEGILFFAGAACGSPGLYLAMLLFRHKTRKWYFQLGIPLLILQNVAVVYVVIKYI